MFMKLLCCGDPLIKVALHLSWPPEVASLFLKDGSAHI